MQENITNLIKKLFEYFPQDLVSVDIINDDETGMTRVDVKTTDNSELIGHEGETLRAIDYIIKKQIEQELPDAVLDFQLDIDGYHAEHIEQLKSQAKILADRARSFEQDVSCPPMSSYERFIIHATLSDYDDIQTESIGYGPERHIVIRRKSNPASKSE
ncbi:MAG: hypothetical protein OEX08_00305 [Candidatus Nomurabacteria bacterium]|nr:hypothetical protein [Candidatus Nomurabacteria bacterium]